MRPDGFASAKEKTDNPASHGCGEYPAWLAWETAAAKHEAADELQDRTIPHDWGLGLLPPELYRVEDGVVYSVGNNGPMPWVAARKERIAIAQEAIAEGLKGSAIDDAIDCTLFARAFEKWISLGCPTE